MSRLGTLHRALGLPLAAALILAVTGCGAGSGQGLDGDGNIPAPAAAPASGAGDGAGGGTAAASGNPNATLAWVQGNVFGGVCSQCHTGVGAPLGIIWSAAANTCSNVGRSSGEMPTMKEIDRGNPDGSYMIWKISGGGPTGQTIQGGRMPLNNPALSAETIKNMRDWVSDGTPGC